MTRRRGDEAGEDPVREAKDPIGEFLREKLAETPLSDTKVLQVPWHTSWTRVVAASCAAIALAALVAAGIIAPGILRDDGMHADTVAAESPETDRGEAAAKRSEIGRVVLVTVGVEMGRDGRMSMPSAGDEVLEGDTIETGDGAAAGLQLGEGSSVVIGPGSRLVVKDRGDRDAVLSLERGQLASRVRGRLVVECAGTRVEGSDALFSVETGSKLAPGRVSVGEGEVLVERAVDGRTWTVKRGFGLDRATWSVEPGWPDRDILDRLEAVMALTEPASERSLLSGSGGSKPKEAGEKQGGGLVSRIRKALADGDVTLAMDIVEQEGSGVKSPEFLLAAADTYAEASEWSAAAERFAAAARDAEGKQAERALIKAAEIRLRKLGDASGAAALLDEYLKRFPSGVYRDEALFLAAAVQAKLGDLGQARIFYEAYLGMSPDGAQALRAHLALAQILALAFHDCAAAEAHVAAIADKPTGATVDAEIAKVKATCGKGEMP